MGKGFKNNFICQLIGHISVHFTNKPNAGKHYEKYNILAHYYFNILK